ncbi:MAG: hypothetical protein RLY93_03620 [Sumerlaeia bacterium]
MVIQKRLGIFGGAFFLALALTAPAQEPAFLGQVPIPDPAVHTAERTKKEAREAFKKEMETEALAGALAQPLTPETEALYRKAFWAALHTRDRSERVKNALGQVLANYHAQTDDETRRKALEAIYGLFPTEFQAEITALLPTITDKKQFAMAAYYLLRIDPDGTRRTIREAASEHFGQLNLTDDPIIVALRRELRPRMNMQASLEKRPPLEDLLGARELLGRTVLFSLHRHNRIIPGIALIRKADGSFLRREDGTLWHIPHLAQSASGLPGTITNGYSPQGLYSITGTGVSENQFIGPTPFIDAYMPFEIHANAWFDDDSGTTITMTQTAYSALLPQGWNRYFPMTEAFLAGKAGRSGIIAHGTTTNPEFYKDEPFYPLVPSLGCIKSLEVWDPQTGKLKKSDQIDLLRSWNDAGAGRGWLVLAEIDTKETPIQLADIHEAVVMAENALGIVPETPTEKAAEGGN